MQYIHCIQDSKKLYFQHHNCYECRGTNTEALIRSTLLKYNIEKDLDFYVQTDDCNYNILPNTRLYNSVTNNKEYDITFPDFFFVSWPQIGIEDYNSLIHKLHETQVEPNTNKIGWIGSLLCNARIDLYNLGTQHECLDIIDIKWIRSNPDKLTASNYMDFTNQIKQWKYFIDIRGGGYSTRLKVLLSTPRICFIVDRPYEEWYHKHLIPWNNYIPVKADLSDLIENYIIIENDKSLYEKIKINQKQLYTKCLTKEAAEEHIKNILTNEY
jgi:hypothetical protein